MQLNSTSITASYEAACYATKVCQFIKRTSSDWPALAACSAAGSAQVVCADWYTTASVTAPKYLALLIQPVAMTVTVFIQRFKTFLFSRSYPDIVT